MVRDLSSSAARCFTGSLEPAAFHVGPPQEEALARLEWLVEHRGRCGLVVGAEGLGKSHLLAVAARRFAGLGAEVAVLSLGGLPAGEWLELLLDRLPLDVRSRAEPCRGWQKLENRLRENALMERTTVLVFDDLDHGPADALEGIARLTAAVEPRFARLVVVATATPQGTPHVPEAIRQRATVRIELEPWGEAEVAGYLEQAVQRAGLDAGLFSPTAVETLTRFAGGVPRIVCRLASLAVVAAAGDGIDAIDAATIERAWRELAPDTATWTRSDVPGTDAAAPAHAPQVRVVRRLWG
jgi:type II secretory pathway predicted ATPase ExeA